MKIFYVFIMIISMSLFTNAQQQVDIKNGFKDYKLNADVSTYTGLISRESYLIAYANDNARKESGEYQSVESANGNHGLGQENCKVWVYIGKTNRYIGNAFVYSIIITSTSNKIIRIEVEYNRNNESDEAVIEYYGKHQIIGTPKEITKVLAVFEGKSCINNKQLRWSGNKVNLDMSIITPTGNCQNCKECNRTILMFNYLSLANTLEKAYILEQMNKEKTQKEKIKKDL